VIVVVVVAGEECAVCAGIGFERQDEEEEERRLLAFILPPFLHDGNSLLGDARGGRRIVLGEWVRN
jgi:hypothetical protein